MSHAGGRVDKLMTKFASIILAMLLSGCKPTIDDRVWRYEDKEAGVVCWVFSSGAYRGGIDCLPIDETKLQR